jgi:hypothetical protein
MADDERTETPESQASGGKEVPEGSVFGNLPRERPGVRSPRRDAEAARRTGRPGSATGERARAAASASNALPRERAEPSRDPQPETEGPPEETGGPGGLEEMAWAGVTVAAEAATLGVRLAGRALDAVREAVERR